MAAMAARSRSISRSRTSPTPARSPRSSCWATSPCGIGRRLEWDAANLQFTNLPEANNYISKTYRDGWSV